MNYDNCDRCGNKLKGGKIKRTKPSTCHKCLGIESQNYELAKFCKENLNTQTELSEDEVVFEDDPKALVEEEKGKVNKQSMGYVYTETPMASSIIEPK